LYFSQEKKEFHLVKDPIRKKKPQQAGDLVPDEYADAIALIRARFPTATNFRQDRVRSFLGGRVHYVSFIDDDGDETVEIVYSEGSNLEYMEFSEDVVEKVQERLRFSTLERMATSILNTGGITGLLALLMTIAVIYLSAIHSEIPKILEQALLLAFGFYFGKVTTT